MIIFSFLLCKNNQPIIKTQLSWSAYVLLITYDVTSMYTNMEFDALINAVYETYKCATKPQSDIPYPNAEDLIFLLKCVLENNYIECNGKY